jgi:hypothetical protein
MAQTGQDSLSENLSTRHPAIFVKIEAIIRRGITSRGVTIRMERRIFGDKENLQMVLRKDKKIPLQGERYPTALQKLYK